MPKMLTASKYNAALAPHIGKHIDDPTVPDQSLGYYPVVNRSTLVIEDWHFADMPQPGFSLAIIYDGSDEIHVWDDGDFLVADE